jgi:hypothetical protein
VIFVVTQIVGIFGGFAWGFGGRESFAAWKTTKGFKTFEDYNNYYAPFRSIAQSQLENLQKRMAENADISGKTFSKTFRDYVLEQRDFSDMEVARNRPAASGAAVDALERDAMTQVSHPQALTVEKSTDEVAVLSPTPVDVSASATIDILIAEIEAEADVARKKALILGLDERVRGDVVNAIKLRKQRAEEAKLALATELDDLFKA